MATRMEKSYSMLMANKTSLQMETFSLRSHRIYLPGMFRHDSVHVAHTVVAIGVARTKSEVMKFGSFCGDESIITFSGTDLLFLGPMVTLTPGKEYKRWIGVG